MFGAGDHLERGYITAYNCIVALISVGRKSAPVAGMMDRFVVPVYRDATDGYAQCLL